MGEVKDEMVIKARQFLDDMERNILKTQKVDLVTYMLGHDIFDEAFSNMENKNWRAAIEGFMKCLEVNRNHPQSYGNMGICLSMLGKKQEALAALDIALSIDPSYLPAVNNRVLIEDLREGEKLEEERYMSIDFSKEKFLMDR